VHKIRRLNIPMEIDANQKIDDVIGKIKSVMSAQDRILKDPPYSINICSFSSSKVNLAVKAWCNTEESEEMYSNIFYALRKELEKD